MGTTPILAIPYVEPGDHLNVYPATMKAQSEAVENTLPPRASRLKSTAQPLTAANTWYTITYDTDEGSKDFTYSNGIFTAAKPGLYLIDLAQHISYTGTAANLQIRISVGALVAAIVTEYSAQNLSLTLARTWRLAAGDTVKAEANSSLAGAAAYGTGPRYSYIDLTRISA